jgi:hypothetical protein
MKIVSFRYVYIPAKTPAAPLPAIARPTMNMLDVTAAPQISDPTWKINAKAKKVGLIGKMEMILPLMGCRAEMVNMYAAPYQPISEVEWKRLVIEGIA